LFYSFKVNTSNTKLEAFTITNFKKGGVTFGFAKEYLAKRLIIFRRQIQGDIPQNESNLHFSSKLNLIQRIMMNVTTPVLIEHSREESKITFFGDQVP
jgi:hypothetical protein